MKTSSYVFGAALALSGVSGLVQQVQAGTITQADFTFETQTASGSALTSPNFSADVGTGTAFQVHATTAATYSFSTGNGSAKAFAGNNFTVGSYYQFSVPTTNIQNILITFDQLSSGTGPGVFNLQYSTDGTTFQTVSGYTVPYITYTTTGSSSNTSASTSATFNTTGSSGFSSATSASNSSFSFAFDLSSITALNNASAAFFRLVDASTLAANGTAAVGASGTSRVDNFILSGDAVASTPEPATLALAGVAGALGLARRRRA